MAKAKKTSSGGSAAKKSKSASKSAKPAQGSPGNPFIDTNLAAQAAAKMIGTKTTGAVGASSNTQSSTFRQLKASLANPASNAMANVLEKQATPDQRRANLPFGGGKQVGHNQTFGADVNRTSIPRRTGG